MKSPIEGQTLFCFSAAVAATSRLRCLGRCERSRSISGSSSSSSSCRQWRSNFPLSRSDATMMILTMLLSRRIRGHLHRTNPNQNPNLNQEANFYRPRREIRGRAYTFCNLMIGQRNGLLRRRIEPSSLPAIRTVGRRTAYRLANLCAI